VLGLPEIDNIGAVFWQNRSAFMRHRRTASEGSEAVSQELFRARLDALIDLSHPLAKLARVMPWEGIENAVSGVFPPAPAGAGRAALPIRLMAGLVYLKHAYNLSDEATGERWLENCYWQYFTGEVYFQTRLPCDPSSFTRWRQRLGEAGMEELLSQTIEAAKSMRAVTVKELSRVIIDSTVQEKAVAYPTDSRLLEIARRKLVKLALEEGLTLRQSYEREGPKLRRRAGGYAHAKQFKRLKRVLRRQRTVLGRVIRDMERKLEGHTTRTSIHTLIERAQRLRTQPVRGKDKLYALHAPEVECIGKGKARQPYEFGVKVGIAITAKRGLIVGARSFPGNPYDGDTLAEQLEQTEILTGHKPHTAIVDLGYRGRTVDGVEILHRGKPKRLTKRQGSWVKRRQAIEPVIGHLKDDCGLRRNRLKGSLGDALHVIACAAGYNLRWLLRWIALFWRSIYRLLAEFFASPTRDISMQVA
jgi:IS5 family transposase